MLQPGATLQGRFTVERILGNGGMGAVYLVRHAHLHGRPMAIKEMTVSISNAEERTLALQHFRHEAEILFDLQHPNLVRVTDFFEEGGHQYLVMDYIEGGTLEDLVEKLPAPLPVSLVCAWIAEIAGVLDYLHRRNPPVILRDLKPANIMVDAAGRLRLIDFGIARVLHDGSQTGLFLKGVATAGFAAIEQYNGTTDPRTDVYALGATFYYLLTRVAPPSSVVRANGEPQPPPSQLNPAVTTEVDHLVTTMLALRPQDRCSSVAEVRRLLQDVFKLLPTDAPARISPNLQRQCTACGTKARALATLCVQCGSLLSEPAWVARDGRAVCPSCLSLLSRSAVSCYTCGRSKDDPSPLGSAATIKPQGRLRDRILGYLTAHPEGADDAALAQALSVRLGSVQEWRRRLQQHGLVRRRGRQTLILAEAERPWSCTWAVRRSALTYLRGEGLKVSTRPNEGEAGLTVVGLPPRTRDCRRWFAQALHVLVQRRGQQPERRLYLALPDDPQYARLWTDIRWLATYIVRFQTLWVTPDGHVTLDRAVHPTGRTGSVKNGPLKSGSGKLGPAKAGSVKEDIRPASEKAPPTPPPVAPAGTAKPAGTGKSKPVELSVEPEPAPPPPVPPPPPAAPVEPVKSPVSARPKTRQPTDRPKPVAAAAPAEERLKLLKVPTERPPSKSIEPPEPPATAPPDGAEGLKLVRPPTERSRPATGKSTTGPASVKPAAPSPAEDPAVTKTGDRTAASDVDFIFSVWGAPEDATKQPVTLPLHSAASATLPPVKPPPISAPVAAPRPKTGTDRPVAPAPLPPTGEPAYDLREFDGGVEVWCTERLPLEPKGALLEMRNRLRGALGVLKPGHGQVLQGVYSSDNRDRCELENVLLYNVGSANFQNVIRHGLRFERSFARPSAGSQIREQGLHHHRYLLADSTDSFTGWAEDRLLAEWDRIIVSDPTKMESVWVAMKKAVVKFHGYRQEGELLGLAFSLRTPTSASRSVPSLLKPLHHGLMAAFQRHDGPLDLVLNRLANRLKLAPVALREWLHPPVPSILGDRRLLAPRDESVQWFPPDDLCVAFELLINLTPGDQWRLSGKLFTVRPLQVALRTMEMEAHYVRLQEARAALSNGAPEPCSGRGILTCASVRFLPHIWILVRSLRHHGCTLPIELWHMADEVPPGMASLLRPYGVECRDAGVTRFKDDHHPRGTHGLKPLAVLLSRFAEVLFLDADNSAVRDPSFLFDTDEYRTTGALFWEDPYPTTAASLPDLYRAFEFGCEAIGRGFESGQFLVDKRRHSGALRIALHANEHFEFYYRYTFGDKDTFRLAFDWLQAPYHLERHAEDRYPGVYGRRTRGITIRQGWHDGPLFIHRCGMYKFSRNWRSVQTWVGNAPRAVVHAWLLELREQWDVVAPPAVDQFYRSEWRRTARADAAEVWEKLRDYWRKVIAFWHWRHLKRAVLRRLPRR